MIMVFIKCGWAVMTYATETSFFTISLLERLIVACRAMGRAMLAIPLRDKTRNVDILYRTRLPS